MLTGTVCKEAIVWRYHMQQFKYIKYALPPVLYFFHDDVAEEEGAGLAVGGQEALQGGAVELLHTAAVDHEDPQAGRDAPDVPESEAAELTAPAQRHGHATDDGQGVVAAAFGAGEQAVRHFPHAVDAVGAVRLRDDILKGDLSPDMREGR